MSSPPLEPGGPVAPVASPPFDSVSPGDCILRSSDGVDYKVFRNILALASPVFQSMFASPRAVPPHDEATDLPIITVWEASSTLVWSFTLWTLILSLTWSTQNAIGGYVPSCGLGWKEEAQNASRYFHTLNLKHNGV
ncbi:hypothetical protein FRB97_001884 [Tulasnella sp. 331]|nr:hypothetical protein FRB97_001884 [Tulasnella sp. 331]